MIGNALVAIAAVLCFCWASTVAWAAWCWHLDRRQARAVEEANRVVAMRRMGLHLVGDNLVTREPSRPFDHEID